MVVYFPFLFIAFLVCIIKGLPVSNEFEELHRISYAFESNPQSDISLYQSAFAKVDALITKTAINDSNFEKLIGFKKSYLTKLYQHPTRRYLLDACLKTYDKQHPFGKDEDNKNVGLLRLFVKARYNSAELVTRREQIVADLRANYVLVSEKEKTEARTLAQALRGLAAGKFPS